jgi:hypothetical protein
MKKSGQEKWGRKLRDKFGAVGGRSPRRLDGGCMSWYEAEVKAQEI